jgi:gluconate 2-dehydrogenase gamma chain
MAKLSRRTLIKTTGALGATMLPAALLSDTAAAKEGQALDEVCSARSVASFARAAYSPPPSSTGPGTYLFFSGDEAAFIEAAVARLIPKDDDWGGALEAGVPNFIDKQLAGAWGAGERLYRGGPWQAGTPSQGYQLPLTPAELFRTALNAVDKELAARPFAKMHPDEQDNYLKSLEAGGKDLGGVPSDVFFSHLWEVTLEGFFSDPVYGGNGGMLSWRMIGFPGAYASYYDLVDQHGIKIDRPPTSLGEDAHGHVHMNPGIPARSP